MHPGTFPLCSPCGKGILNASFQQSIGHFYRSQDARQITDVKPLVNTMIRKATTKQPKMKKKVSVAQYFGSRNVAGGGEAPGEV